MKFLIVLLALVLSTTAMAQEHRGGDFHGGRDWHHHDWHGGWHPGWREPRDDPSGFLGGIIGGIIGGLIAPKPQQEPPQ